MIITNNLLTFRELSNWTREFAEITLPVCANPSIEIVRQAISTYLDWAEPSPEATVEKLLEQFLGISVIVQYGRERVGWTATATAEEADMLQQSYSSATYSKIRHELGIDGHWIFLTDPNLCKTLCEGRVGPCE